MFILFTLTWCHFIPFYFGFISAEEFFYRNQWGGISLLNALNLSERVLMSNVTFVSIFCILFSVHFIQVVEKNNKTRKMRRKMRENVSHLVISIAGNRNMKNVFLQNELLVKRPLFETIHFSHPISYITFSFLWSYRKPYRRLHSQYHRTKNICCWRKMFANFFDIRRWHSTLFLIFKRGKFAFIAPSFGYQIFVWIYLKQF